MHAKLFKTSLVQNCMKERIGIGTAKVEGLEVQYQLYNPVSTEPLPRYWSQYSDRKVHLSREIPERFREAVAAHEILKAEKHHRDPQASNYCLAASVSELKYVPQGEMIEYLRFREESFRSLVEYMEKHLQHSHSQEIDETRKSHQLMKDLLEQHIQH